MADFKPLAYSILIILILGLIVPFFLNIFIDTTDVRPAKIASPIVWMIDSDFEINLVFTTIHLNPFYWAGEEVRTTIVNSLNATGLYPAVFINTIMILCLLALIFSIITLVRGN